ncbi:hypothetical protein K438DRAFT_1774179 [Mycena galopus ATCC 62051]|nr:hypothetical protein K438DRAFT_1774179 [Mycena galopus ATCC 62051]
MSAMANLASPARIWDSSSANFGQGQVVEVLVDSRQIVENIPVRAHVTVYESWLLKAYRRWHEISAMASEGKRDRRWGGRSKWRSRVGRKAGSKAGGGSKFEVTESSREQGERRKGGSQDGKASSSSSGLLPCAKRKREVGCVESGGSNVKRSRVESGTKEHGVRTGTQVGGHFDDLPVLKGDLRAGESMIEGIGGGVEGRSGGVGSGARRGVRRGVEVNCKLRSRGGSKEKEERRKGGIRDGKASLSSSGLLTCAKWKREVGCVESGGSKVKQSSGVESRTKSARTASEWERKLEAILPVLKGNPRAGELSRKVGV